MSDLEKIRKFEKEILDKRHTEFELYQYSDDIVIPYLLQTYGDTERHSERLIENGHTEADIGVFLHKMMHGISYCIRWIKLQKQPKYKFIENDTTALKLSMDFINWGITYYIVAQEFVAWSRGIKSVVLNENGKTISFIPPDTYDYLKVFPQQMLYKKQLLDTYKTYPSDELEKEFSLWIKEIDLKRHVANSIDWTKAKQSKVYSTLLAKINEIILPELSPETDLDCYTLADLRQFYTLIYLNFSFIKWCESVLDYQNGNNLFLGSNPLYLSQQEFIELASLITDLNHYTVAAIIKDLTFDATNPHSTISIQPFISSNSGVYYILPNLFTLSDPSRMIVGALNKGPKKKVYDRLINKIEITVLKGLSSSVLENTPWHCFLQKNIKYSGKQIQPDFVLVDNKNLFVLVIDYKHFIAPITTSEVEYRMKELKKGIEQVTNYMSIISNKDTIGSLSITNHIV